MRKKGSDIQKAMQDAKRLEQNELPTVVQLAEQYKKDMKRIADARKLLKKAWFVRDAEPKVKKAAKAKKGSKKKIKRRAKKVIKRK